MIFFFYGENTYMAKAKIREMRERYVKSTGSDFGLERFDHESSANEILSALTSLPFLANSRLVVLENLSQNKQLAEKVVNSLTRVPEATVAVFYEDNIDRRTTLFKSLKDGTKSTEFKPLSGVKLIAWLQKTAQTNGGEIDTATAKFMVEHAGTDQWRLEQELKKLINAGSKITTDLIKELVEQVPEQTVFDMVEALARGNVSRALKHYEGLRSQAAQPLYILAMIGWQLRNLLLVKAAGSRSAQTIASEAKVSPFVINKTIPIAKGLELADLQIAYKRVIDTDYVLKTSQNDPDIVLEQLMLAVAKDLYGDA